ncbi:MAG TPA: hypothetical protein VF540_10035, partial [Segetibacter sp.]
MFKSVEAQNFQLLKDVNPFTDSDPYNLYHNYAKNNYAILNGISYFIANDGFKSGGLWRSDGTAEGTYQIKKGSFPYNITVSNGKLFFSDNGTYGLWTSDGTEAGTVPVLTSIPAGLTYFNPHDLTDVNGTVYFSVTARSFDEQLWKSNGTKEGTMLVKDFYSSNRYSLTNFTAVHGKLYFNLDDGKLWTSNGTTSGTYSISDNIYQPSQATAWSSDITDPLTYFTATSQKYSNDRQLFVTVGNAGEASLVNKSAGIIFTYSSANDPLVNIGGTLYFTGYSL